MASQATSTVANPFDVQALLQMKGHSVEFAEQAYRAWLDAVGRAQGETVKFLKDRAEVDFAAVGDLTRCTTVAEMLDLQTQYVAKAFSDFVSEGQKLGAIFNDTVTRSAS